MDKQPTVVFRNVGQLYFPQTRVECHYSLTSEHQWSTSDWIGIFKVGWTSVKEYYTYTWAMVPEGYTERTPVNCCALFHSFFLPRPSSVEYQFVYIDKMGEVCARSRPFTFRAPKPLDELETMKEDQEEDGDEELLLVIPRAQLLQSRLEECLNQREDLERVLGEAKKEVESEKERNKKAKMEWESEREATKEEILELRGTLRHKSEMLKRIEGKHKDVTYSQENLNSELSKLLDERVENQQRIKELEDNLKLLTDREREENMEVERLKERLKNMSSQMKHDKEKRKSLQAENEAALAEVRGLQDHLEASENVAESLRRELRELGARQSLTHTELHQARLQVAQLTLQLSEENLTLREERAHWALERETYKHASENDKKKLQELSCEVQREEEWLREERLEREKLELELQREKDCNRVLLGETKRELQELKATLKKVQREKEEQQLEKQDMVKYVRQLEQRLGINGDVLTSVSPGASDGDDEPGSSSVLTHLDRPDRADVPDDTQVQNKEDTSDTDTQEEKKQQCCGQQILPELVHPVLRDSADSPMW
ncbi:calcium-binding and coiled-coil domain-containing protein 1-like [Aulostomus maculatus]